MESTADFIGSLKGNCAAWNGFQKKREIFFLIIIIIYLILMREVFGITSEAEVSLGFLEVLDQTDNINVE